MDNLPKVALSKLKHLCSFCKKEYDTDFGMASDTVGNLVCPDCFEELGGGGDEQN